MQPRLTALQLLGKNVLGQNIFPPPFKAQAALENEARFVYFVNGRTKLWTPNRRLELRTSDSILMKTSNFVNHWLENEDSSMSEVIVLQIYPDVLKLVYDDRIPDLFSKKHGVVPQSVEKIPFNPMIGNFVESLRFYFDNQSMLNDEFIKLKIRELVMILVNSDSTGAIKTILSDLFLSHEYEFKEIIRANLFEDLKLQDLAFLAGMSLSTFKRKFKEVYDTSPAQYIKFKRLEKAKNMLEQSSQRISDIAYDCGFNDVGYFSKAFASAYQLSPSEYRKNSTLN